MSKEERTDDKYNKLRNDLGTDFRKNNTDVRELFSFHCGKCGYHNIQDVSELECGCGSKIQGILVYRRIADTVVYDNREKKFRKR